MAKQYKGLIDCILGVILTVFSIMAICSRSLFLIKVFDILGVVLLINGLHEGYDYFYFHHTKVHLHNALIFIAAAVILLCFPIIPLTFTTIIFSLYLTLNGVVKFISYLNYRKDKVRGRNYVLIGSVILCFNGFALLSKDYINLDIVMIFIGIYGVLLGVTYIVDGIFTVLPAKRKENIKRRIRIPLPIALSALIPRSMSLLINRRFETERQQVNWDNDEVDLEVFVHVSPDGFGIMGHCDLYFEGEVLSYGNYDQHSTRLFEAVGDGVLFSVTDKKKYLQFCIKEDKKTIFGYGLKLTEMQKRSVHKKIAELKMNALQWYPVAYYQSDCSEDYASRLYKETGAHFYKFKKGKFKTYFVLGTNCVLLADQIIGSAGTDIIDLNGIIAPGTYQSYLEKEYQKQNGFVIKKEVYY